MRALFALFSFPVRKNPNYGISGVEEFDDNHEEDNDDIMLLLGVLDRTGSRWEGARPVDRKSTRSCRTRTRFISFISI